MIRDYIQIVWSLLNSPIVWFALLLLAVTYIGLFLVLLKGGSSKPTPPMPKPDFDSPAARRYHGGTEFNR